MRKKLAKLQATKSKQNYIPKKNNNLHKKYRHYDRNLLIVIGY